MKMYAVVGRSHDRTPAVSPRRNRGCFIDVLHEQSAEERIVSVGVTGQDDVLFDGQRLGHCD